ncbi:MAG: DNA recombination/repair protein RecA, partial [Selenomonadaceae bacterium]|nr:DNA recombination/repair protein RecA [Selenomonadaceae bacterium]
VKIKVAKNKVAPPFRTAEFDLIYGEGYSRFGSIVDLGVMFDLVTKSGAYFSYNGERLGQGRENAKKYLQEHLEIADEIENKLRDALMKSTATIKPEPENFDDEEEPFDGDED